MSECGAPEPGTITRAIGGQNLLAGPLLLMERHGPCCPMGEGTRGSPEVRGGRASSLQDRRGEGAGGQELTVMFGHFPCPSKRRQSLAAGVPGRGPWHWVLTSQ